MKCIECDFYKSGSQWNCCGLDGAECFHTILDCTLVNDDQTINEEEMEKMYGKSVD